MRTAVAITLGFFVFISGLIIGAINPITSHKTDNDLVLSEKVKKTFAVPELTVFQVIERSIALVKSGNFLNEQIYLLLHDKEDLYYDGEKIKITKDKIIKQVGTFRYETRAGFAKTVPAIRIESTKNAKNR